MERVSNQDLINIIGGTMPEVPKDLECYQSPIIKTTSSSGTACPPKK